MMINPTNMDVLCGKDKFSMQAPGSRRFRQIIDSYASRYTKLESKFDKMTLTREIYEVVCQDSRFLKFNESTQEWELVGNAAARDKIGHSLRFAGRTTRRRPRKTHRRTGSNSSGGSTESESSTTSGGDVSILMGDMQLNTLAGHFAKSLQQQENCDPLAEFLKMDLPSQTENPLAMAFEQWLEEPVQQQQETDEPEAPLETFVNDIIDVVNTLDSNVDATESDFLALLREPVGDF